MWPSVVPLLLEGRGDTGGLAKRTCAWHHGLNQSKGGKERTAKTKIERKGGCQKAAESWKTKDSVKSREKGDGSTGCRLRERFISRTHALSGTQLSHPILKGLGSP